MREDDRTGVSEARPDRQYRMPPCPIHSQFRVVGHDLGGRTHRTCPLSDFEPRSTWLKGATWEIPVESFSVAAKTIVQREYVFSRSASTTMKAQFGSATEALTCGINDPELAFPYLLTE